MRQRPILFSGPMVRAILDGSKTQTRRIVKPQPVWNTKPYTKPGFFDDAGRYFGAPYGRPGDRLWVRETWMDRDGDGRPIYRADLDGCGQCPQTQADGSRLWITPKGPWKPSIHIPRRFSRLTLEITEVHVERLQDISEDDATAEGIVGLTKDGNLYKYGVGEPSEAWKWQDWPYTPKDAYRHLWGMIHGPLSWNENPWVWAISFTRAPQGKDVKG